MRGQSLETAFPEAAIEGEPLRGLADRRGIEAAAAMLAVAAALDEPGALEHTQMPRDRRQRDGEGLGQLPHRRLARGEPRQDGAPRRIRKRGKGQVESGRGGHDLTDRTINISVKYQTRRGAVKPLGVSTLTLPRFARAPPSPMERERC